MYHHRNMSLSGLNWIKSRVAWSDINHGDKPINSRTIGGSFVSVILNCTGPGGLRALGTERELERDPEKRGPESARAVNVELQPAGRGRRSTP